MLFVKKFFLLLYLLVIGCYSVIKSLLKGKRSYSGKNRVDDKILILGNGPSLSNLDLSIMRKRINFACVNWFAIQNTLFRELKPSYYVLIDGAFFISEEMLPEKQRNDRRLLINELSIVDWKMTIILPQKCCLKLDNSFITYEAVSTSILYNDYVYGFMNFLYSKNLAVCGLQNVIVGALHYFIMKKVQNIYIAGVDMSEFQCYKVDKRNHVLAKYTHFYGVNNMDCTEMGRIPKGEFSRWMGYYARMLKEFYCLKQFADYQKVKVINFSEDSFIDVFDKQNWKEFVDV